LLQVARLSSEVHDEPLERAKEQAERTGTRTRSRLRGRIQVKRERLGLCCNFFGHDDSIVHGVFPLLYKTRWDLMARC